MSSESRGLAVNQTAIPGLLILDLPVHGDARGWFKENWQREKMTRLGLPDFTPVQHNISFNARRGVTRGIHAEPWDKYISVATGRIFAAWVDLREGPSFGAVVTAELGPETAVFVPRGVGNAYQTLEDHTSYVYLVTEHWSEAAQAGYTFLNLADETVAIPWPIPLGETARSEQDLVHPRLRDVEPMPPQRTLILGADGQLGRALRRALPSADAVGRARVDLASPEPFIGISWPDYDVVINAAAYTAVDAAESEDGRRDAWAVNVAGVTELARVAREHDLTVVHLSSDYVFDGSQEAYAEDDPVSPLSVYGQTKAAGDAVVATVPRHYIVRTSWLVGDGKNFVRTMASLAQRGVDPSVVDDQRGRLTFVDDLAAGIVHLLRTRPEPGIYNLTGAGSARSWADIARQVFELLGHDPARITGVSSAEYFAGKPAAPRPRRSVLVLDKILETGYRPRDGDAGLLAYLKP